MSTELQKVRERHYAQGKYFALAAAVVCFAASMGIADSIRGDEHPPDVLKLLSPFAMACAVVLGSYAALKTPTRAPVHQAV